MRKVWYSLSFVMICALLASCSEQNTISPGYNVVLKEVKNTTGYSFDTLSHSEVRGDSNVTVFLRSSEVDENTAALTVTEYIGQTTWIVSAWRGSDLLTTTSTGYESVAKNARDLEAVGDVETQGVNQPPPKPPPGGCWKCAKTEKVPGRYKEDIITEWVREGLAASTAAACSRAGGTWAAAGCYVIVKRVTKVLTWVPGYTKCVKRKHVSPCPNPRVVGLPVNKN